MDSPQGIPQGETFPQAAPRDKTSKASQKCPIFDPEETEYEVWKKRAILWAELERNNLSEKDRSIALFLSLRGRAETGVGLTVKEISTPDGFQKIIDKLDDIYLLDAYERQYFSFDDMIKMRKEPDQDMRDFIIDFDQKYCRFEALNQSLPSVIIGYILISACMLSLNDFRMVKTGIGKDISYENTKENLKRIFANRSNSTHSKTESSRDNSSNSSDTGVFYGKSESAENDASLYARRGRDRNNSNRRNYPSKVASYRDRYQGGFRNQNSRESYKGRNSGGYRRSYKRPQQENGMNPAGRNGLPEACKVCNSIYHFRRECPDLKRESPELNRRNDEKRDSNGPDIIQYAYFVGCASDMEYNDNLDSLAKETKG